MLGRDTVYLLACTIAPVLACTALVSFAFSQFLTAWLCALGIVLLMETRVQAGERLPHTAFFWTHLCAAVPFFLTLTALAFVAQPFWLVALTAAAGLVAFYTGAVLWHRGVQARVVHLKR